MGACSGQAVMEGEAMRVGTGFALCGKVSLTLTLERNLVGCRAKRPHWVEC